MYVLRVQDAWAFECVRCEFSLDDAPVGLDAEDAGILGVDVTQVAVDFGFIYEQLYGHGSRAQRRGRGHAHDLVHRSPVWEKQKDFIELCIFSTHKVLNSSYFIRGPALVSIFTINFYSSLVKKKNEKKKKEASIPIIVSVSTNYKRCDLCAS